VELDALTATINKIRKQEEQAVKDIRATSS
jgi:hypothetical protein